MILESEQPRSGQLRSGRNAQRAAQIGAAQIGAAQIGAMRRSGQLRSGQLRSWRNAQIGAAQIGAAQIGAAQIGAQCAKGSSDRGNSDLSCAGTAQPPWSVSPGTRAPCLVSKSMKVKVKVPVSRSHKRNGYRAAVAAPIRQLRSLAINEDLVQEAHHSAFRIRQMCPPNSPTICGL